MVSEAWKGQIMFQKSGNPAKHNSDTDYIPLQNKSWLKTNWTIVIGIFCLIGGIGSIGQDGQAALFEIITGIVLTLAHSYPQIKARWPEMAEKAAEVNAKKIEKEAKRAEEEAIAEAPKRCKTCGATTKGKICEYCSSLLEQ